MTETNTELEKAFNDLEQELTEDYSTFFGEELIPQTDIRLNPADSTAMAKWGCAYRVGQAYGEAQSLLSGGRAFTASEIWESVERNVNVGNTVDSSSLFTPNMVGVANDALAQVHH